MREIKFRVWDKIKKVFRYEEFIKSGDDKGSWWLFDKDRNDRLLFEFSETPFKIEVVGNIYEDVERK